MDVFLEEWLDHSEWWFDPKHSYDELIIKKYQHILDDNPHGSSEACVVFYDQFPRHYYRGQPASHIIEYYLQKSLEILNQIKLIKYDGNLLCFMLLPLRHSNKFTNIVRATNTVWNRIQNKSGCTMYTKFLKAAYSKCDGAQITLHTPVKNYLLEKDEHVFEHILDKRCLASVTHSSGFLFLRSALVDVNKNHICYKNVDYAALKGPLIVSISGGLDSMVLSYIMMRQDIDFVCVHINYNNRDTSLEEEEFVISWCKFYNISLHVRRIEEISRPLCMEHELRNTYEDYTRKIRYATYKHVGESSVVLGHNKDDCFENIITNINSFTKYENLYGMKKESNVDNINFIRPLIDVPKSAIYNFADSHSIPYLYDSTPSWSSRGKIRDKIVPVMNEWDKSLIPSFFKLTEHMAGLVDIMHVYLKPILNTKTNDGSTITISAIDPIPPYNLVWKTIIQELSLPLPSKKSLDSFCDRYAAKPDEDIFVNFSKELSMKLIDGRHSIFSHNKCRQM
jgi:tRNA(Ile)-lysidine synthetase-like protein